MHIAVVGIGPMGSSLGRRWARSGHEVCFTFSRSDERLKELAGVAGAGAGWSSLREAVTGAEVILMAIPWPLVPQVLGEIGELASGKVLIDCTNPLNADHTELVIGHAWSGGEEVARLARDAAVVKAFNTVFGRVLDPDGEWQPTDAITVPVCGDDRAAKAVVSRLATDADLVALDVGDLSQARRVEPLALLEILVWQQQERMLNLRFTSAQPLTASVAR